MKNIVNLKILTKNLKCIGSEWCGYETIKPINLVIGRNNSGKSTLIDLVEFAFGKDYKHLGHKNEKPEILLNITEDLQENDLKTVFRVGHAGGGIPCDHWEYGKRFLNKKMVWELPIPGRSQFFSIDEKIINEYVKGCFENLVGRKKNPLESKIFKRLLSDRDLLPEENKGSISISPNGEGATDAIQKYLTKAILPSNLVEETILSQLNLIFEPDSRFEEILVQVLEDGRWEIYLEENSKGRIPLSRSGSGLKTILLVLLYLYLIPHIEQKPLDNFFFGFEELENNLHPTLQRRLFSYLLKIALEKGCKFFLTTHSNVVIDLFSNIKEANILHVTHNGEKASIRTVKTYMENRNILDDIGVRASDLLQSNCIVWVEGPSDRVYFNRWIELWAEDEIREGTHYQCVFYGGRLLAQLSFADPTIEQNDLINILKVNRNALIIADSDRKKKTDQPNETKKRIVLEIETMGGTGWITECKEIENYIPVEALQSYFNKDLLNPIGKFQHFQKYLGKIDKKLEKQFSRDKVKFAQEICPHIKRENLENIFDLKEKLDLFISLIRQWNGK